MTTFLTVLHVMVCLVIIVVVLLQRGKGAEIGAVFGGGASSTVFGSRGAGNFLTKITAGAAVTFMVTSLTLSYFNAEARQGERLFEEVEGVEPIAPEEPDSPFGEIGVTPTTEPIAEPEAAPAPGPEAPAGEAPAETPPSS